MLGAGGSRLYPSYSGSRDQEKCSSKSARANSLRDPISKIPNTKRAGGVAQGVGPEFKPWYHKKKKKLFLISLYHFNIHLLVDTYRMPTIHQALLKILKTQKEKHNR
jgi:hypothetical protein